MLLCKKTDENKYNTIQYNLSAADYVTPNNNIYPNLKLSVVSQSVNKERLRTTDISVSPSTGSKFYFVGCLSQSLNRT
jgi:hypothetical protein